MRADLVLFSPSLDSCEKISAPDRPADIAAISSYLQMFASAHKIGSNGDWRSDWNPTYCNQRQRKRGLAAQDSPAHVDRDFRGHCSRFNMIRNMP